MVKPGQQQRQFNIKVTGQSEIATVEAVQKYCSENKINISDFVVTALRNALDSNLVPPDDLTVVNRRLDSLEQNINQEISQLKNDIQLLKQSAVEPPVQPKDKKPVIKTIGYLKNYNILPKKINVTEKDIGKFFDGNNGSKWQYLGRTKGNQKQFQRVS